MQIVFAHVLKQLHYQNPSILASGPFLMIFCLKATQVDAVKALNEAIYYCFHALRIRL